MYNSLPVAPSKHCKQNKIILFVGDQKTCNLCDADYPRIQANQSN